MLIITPWVPPVNTPPIHPRIATPPPHRTPAGRHPALRPRAAAGAHPRHYGRAAPGEGVSVAWMGGACARTHPLSRAAKRWHLPAFGLCFSPLFLFFGDHPPNPTQPNPTLSNPHPSHSPPKPRAGREQHARLRPGRRRLGRQGVLRDAGAAG